MYRFRGLYCNNLATACYFRATHTQNDFKYIADKCFSSLGMPLERRYSPYRKDTSFSPSRTEIGILYDFNRLENYKNIHAVFFFNKRYVRIKVVVRALEERTHYFRLSRRNYGCNGPGVVFHSTKLPIPSFKYQNKIVLN